MNQQEKLQILQQALMESHETVYLAGVSFMLGVLCTIFLLVILDLMRVLRENREAQLAQDVIEEEEHHAPR